jgi:hypothetical protein
VGDSQRAVDGAGAEQHAWRGLRLTFSVARDDDLLFGGPARGFAGVDLRVSAREV